jgi:oligoribonuclease NrnB/cAMP/cGMP phosphodiesterase (DHH superfamily)
MHYKLYTHNDLDGVSCAILAKLLWEDCIDINYCSSPDEVTTRLIEDKDNKQTDLIFVTDCSFDFDKIKDKRYIKDKIRLFDHHATALPLATESEYFIVKTHREDGKPTCGAEIFYNYLKERRGFTLNCDWFIEQVRLYDTWDWTHGNSKTPKYLSMLLYTNSISHFVDSFVKKMKLLRLSELNVFSEKERAILEYEEYKQSKALDKALESCYIVHTDKYSYGVLFGDYNMSDLGNAICNTCNVDIAVGINLNNEIMSVRTKRTDIDLGKFMKEHFNGGGHPQAAGASVKGNAKKIFETIFKQGVTSFEHKMLSRAS